MFFYPAALPLSRQTLTYTAGIIRRHRRQFGCPWRKLGRGQQALLVLAYPRKGETFAVRAAGFSVGTANRAHARPRAPGGRANAQLKSWRILRKLRCCPWRAGQPAKAIHVLQTREIAG